MVWNRMALSDDEPLTPDLRAAFNRKLKAGDDAFLLDLPELRCGGRIESQVAETLVFMPLILLDEMAHKGAELAPALMGNPV